MKVEIRFHEYAHETHGRVLQADMTVDGVQYSAASAFGAVSDAKTHAALLSILARGLSRIDNPASV